VEVNTGVGVETGSKNICSSVQAESKTAQRRKVNIFFIVWV
jgi:hypothetical protein